MAGLLNASRGWPLICKLQGPEEWEVYHVCIRKNDWHDINVRLLDARAYRRSWWLSWNSRLKHFAQRPANENLEQRYAALWKQLQMRLRVCKPPQPQG